MGEQYRNVLLETSTQIGNISIGNPVVSEDLAAVVRQALCIVRWYATAAVVASDSAWLEDLILSESGSHYCSKRPH